MAELQLDEKLRPEWLWQRFLFSISITHSSIHPPTEPSIHPSLHLSFIVTASASPPPSLPSVSSGAQWPLPFHLHLLPPSRWGTPRLAVPRECSASLWTRAIGTTSWASSPGGWAGSSPWWCPFPRRAPACPCRRRCSLQSERGGQAGVGKPQRRLRVSAHPGWGSRCAHNPVLTNSNGHTHTHTCAHCQTLRVLLNLLGPVLCFVFLGWDFLRCFPFSLSSLVSYSLSLQANDKHGLLLHVSAAPRVSLPVMHQSLCVCFQQHGRLTNPASRCFSF